MEAQKIVNNYFDGNLNSEINKIQIDPKEQHRIDLVERLRLEIKKPLYGSSAHLTLLAYSYLRNKPAFKQSWTISSWIKTHQNSLAWGLQNLFADLEGVKLKDMDKDKRKAEYDALLAWISTPPSQEWVAKRDAATKKAQEIARARKEKCRLAAQAALAAHTAASRASLVK